MFSPSDGIEKMKVMQPGPLLAANAVITPINGLINKWATAVITWIIVALFIAGRGPLCDCLTS